MKKKYVFSLLAVSMLFGLLLSIQLKSAIKILGVNIFPSEKLKELMEEYDSVRGKNEELEEELAGVEESIKEYQEIEAESSERIRQLQEEYRKYRVFAGYEDTSGPGVVVIIEDPLMENSNDSSFIVQNYNYILQIITILNDNGAEAVGINGERYTNYTELISMDKELLVNGEKISPPIRISAIGDIDRLKRGLNVQGNVVWEMKNVLNYNIRVNSGENIAIKGYNFKKDFIYANPIGED